MALDDDRRAPRYVERAAKAAAEARAKAGMQALELAMAMAVPVHKGDARPLYVSRALKNADDLVAWAKRQGIPNPIPGDKMHVTLIYSKAPVDWLAMGNAWSPEVTVEEGGPRIVERLGPRRDVIALTFASDALQWRNTELREKGASTDYPEYLPHVTVSVDVPDDFDHTLIAPYTGKLVFGPEIFEGINEDWKATLVAKYSPHQPRAKDGKWTIGGGGGGGLTAPQLGQGSIAAHRYAEDPQMKAFMAPLTQAEATGKPAYLGNPHGFVNLSPVKPTPVEGNENPDDVATFTSDADPGPGLNGVAFAPWAGPEGGDWTKVEGQGNFTEPPLPNAKGKRLGAGVIIQEPDGRVWTINPLNAFGGYVETLPKGGIEEGLDLRQTAIKEAWEESGLQVELTGYVGDFERNTSVARYYTARRIGGDPTDFHWETAATNLVPMEDLTSALTHPNDAPIVAKLQGASDLVVKAALAYADLVELVGEIVQKAKAWSKQPRVPSGFATGGQWTKGSYGGGAWGGMHAEAGVPLTLQKWQGEGPQGEALNLKIAAFEEAANNGYLHPAAAKLVAKPKPAQTYSAAAWESAHEAKAYIDGKAASPKVEQPKPSPQGTATMGTYGSPMKLSDMTKTAPKPGGSSQGAIYTDKNGDQWVVKSYSSEAMASNEVAAARLYAMAGVAVPDMRLIDLGTAYNGGLGVASKMVAGASSFNPNNPEHVALAQKDFGAHAALANWDAVGLSFDNIVMDADGHPVMIDPGGSLLFRAQGTPKGAAFAPTVGETGTMRDPKVNPTAAKVFGPMTGTQMADSYTKVLAGLQDGNGNLKVEAVEMVRSMFPKGSKDANTILMRMDSRLMDLKAQADSLNAQVLSTTTVKIEETGTEKGNFASLDPQAANLAAKSFVEIDGAIATSMASIDAVKENFPEGASTVFYMKEIDKLTAQAASGKTPDLYVPSSAKAKLSPAYQAYKQAHGAATKMALATQAKNAKEAAVDGTQSVAAQTSAKIKVLQEQQADYMQDAQTQIAMLQGAEDGGITGAAVGLANQWANLLEKQLELAEKGEANYLTPPSSNPNIPSTMTPEWQMVEETIMDGIVAVAGVNDAAKAIKAENYKLSVDQKVVDSVKAQVDAANAQIGEISSKVAAQVAVLEGLGDKGPAWASSLEGQWKKVMMGQAVVLTAPKGAPVAYKAGLKQLQALEVAKGQADKLEKQLATVKEQAVINASPAAKTTLTPPPGGLVTGASDVTTAQVDAMVKTAGGTTTADPSPEQAAALTQAKAAPKPSAPPKAVTPPPALPAKPKVSSPSNPNPKLVALANKAESIANSGSPDAVAQLKGLATQVTGTNTFNKNLKNYIANSILALGGDASMATMSQAQKVAGTNKGIDDGLAVKTQLMTTPPVTAGTTVTQSAPVTKGGKTTWTETHTSPFSVVTKTFEKTEFDASQIAPYAHDFNAHPNAGGKPLSSKPHINAANNAHVAAIYELAKKNDLAGLAQYDVSDGNGNFSSHVVGYKSHMIEKLQEFQTGKLVSKEVQATGKAGDFIGYAANSAKPKKASEAGAGKIEQVGFYLKIADVGPAEGVMDAMPQTALHGKGGDPKTGMTIYNASHKAASAADAGSAIKHWTSNSSFGSAELLRKGKSTSASYKSAVESAKKVAAAAVPLPMGTKLIRGINLAGYMDQMKAAEGSILQEVSPTSWTFDMSAAWPKDTLLVGVTAPEAKGVWAGNKPGESAGNTGNGPALSSYSHEQEMLMPPASRMYIQKVWTRKEWMAAGKADGPPPIDMKSFQNVVEVIMLPYDAKDFQP